MAKYLTTIETQTFLNPNIMKKIFSSALLLFAFIGSINAQIGINSTNTSPNASAMLDVSSTSKGLLIPRMTTAQKNAIANKAEGLTVYDTDLKLFSYWKINALIGSWVDFPQLLNNSGQFWQQNGNDIYNSNIANVGIGINSPSHAKLELVGQIGSAVAMFGSDKNGVTISADNPEIGLNYFYNGGTKTIKAGFGANIGMYPTTGEIYIGNFNGNQSTTDFGEITGYQNVMSIKQNGIVGIAGRLSVGSSIDPNSTLLSIKGANADGSAVFGGTTHNSYFHYGSSEDVFIRGGLDGSKVILNDGALGNVGIGLTNPRAKLTVLSTSVLGNNNTEVFQMAGKNPVMLLSDQNGSDWGYIKGVTDNSATPQFPFGGIEIGAPPGLDVYLSTNFGPALTVHHVNNNVGIGITNPSNKLEVNGTIRSKELIVESFPWPDYVFETNYDLRSLPELEAYIKVNKHLPGIASAKEIEKNGLKVGEINKAMVEKIEELTLYIIKMQKEINLMKIK